jgi:hypothetical protein
MKASDIMTEIRVFDLFGPFCDGEEDGAKLSELTREALNHGETVCLDFTGVTTLIPPFLGPAIGHLYAFFDKDDIEKRVVWKGLAPIDEEIVRLIKRKAILFYSVSESVREALLESTAGGNLPE